jgi:hypothetical protein
MSKSRRNNLWLSLALGLVLMLLSYARIVGDSQSMAFREEVLDTIFAGSIWGTQLMWNLIWFGVILTALHLALGLATWGLGTLSAGVSPKPDQQKNERQHVILWFAFLTIAILAFNSAEFSRSSLGSPYARIMTNSIAGLALGKWIAGVIAVQRARGAGNCPREGAACGLAPVPQSAPLCGGRISRSRALVAVGWTTANHSRNDGSRLNVVLIGIDSLRIDIVGKQAPAGVAPHMREFLDGSVWFTDTMTPLARTFPSVMSILTGRQPHKTGAYMNLPRVSSSTRATRSAGFSAARVITVFSRWTKCALRTSTRATVSTSR